ncbi:hypothetical protein V6N13_081029 [Hibiscus sabdariffa]
MLSILTQIFLFLHTAAWDSGRLPPLADDFPCVLNNCVVAIVTDRVRIAWFLSAVVSCAVSVAESCLLGDYSLSLLNPRFGFFGRRSWTVQGPGSWFSGAVWLSFTVVHWMQIIWDLDTSVFWAVVHCRNLMSTAVFWAVAHCRNLMSYPLLWWQPWLLQPAQYYNWILLPRRPCCSRQRRLLLWLPAPFLFIFSFSHPCALLSDPLHGFYLWQVLRRCDFWAARCLYGRIRRVTSILDFLERTLVVKTNSGI